METTPNSSARAKAASPSGTSTPAPSSQAAISAAAPTPVTSSPAGTSPEPNASPAQNASSAPASSSPHKPTLVLGASDNPDRYSFLAVNKLRNKQHPVTAIGRKNARIADLEIVTGQPPLKDIDTVTVYLNPQNQKEYYHYILSLHPKRIIFNPGAENPELAALAKANGIQPVEACTLVLLSTGQF